MQPLLEIIDLLRNEGRVYIAPHGETDSSTTTQMEAVGDSVKVPTMAAGLTKPARTGNTWKRGTSAHIGFGAYSSPLGSAISRCAATSRQTTTSEYGWIRPNRIIYGRWTTITELQLG